MEISLKWILLNFSYFILVDFLPRNFISGDEMLLPISDWLRNLLIENRNVPIKRQIIFSSYKFLKHFVTFSHLSQTGDLVNNLEVSHQDKVLTLNRFH